MIDFEGNKHDFRAGPDGLCDRHVVTEFREAPFMARRRDGTEVEVTNDMSTYAICRKTEAEHEA